MIKIIPLQFQQIALEFPDKIAIGNTPDLLTYNDLYLRVCSLKSIINKKLDHSNKVVAILTKKGAPCVTSLLATLASGKIVVPLDPALPLARLNNILNDCQPSLIITEQSIIEEKFPEIPRHCSVILLDSNKTMQSDTDLEPWNIQPDQLSWICYTSGSSGKPKGVLYNHRNFFAEINRFISTHKINSDDRVSHLLSPNVIGGMREILSAMLSGATLYIFDIKISGLRELKNWLLHEQITICRMVSSIFRPFLRTLTSEDTFSTLRLIYLGGETVSRREVEEFQKQFSQNCILAVVFGSSETGLCVTELIRENSSLPTKTIPIGQPIISNSVHVVNRLGKQLLPGEIGEIVVSGSHMALGYWQNKELTQTAFRPGPLGKDTPAYWTGDLGRWTPDGHLEHLGRGDSQVQIMGNRVEIGEVENTLLSVDWIENLVVLPVQESGNTRLVAFVVTESSPENWSRDLNQVCTESLPSYAFPSEYIFVKSLPRTVQGKIDRNQLTTLIQKTSVTTRCLEPADRLEKEILLSWQRILKRKTLSVTDDFFYSGGNSILALELLDHLEHKYQITLTPDIFLICSNVRKLAKKIREKNSFDSDQIKILRPGSIGPLFFMHSVAGTLLDYGELIQRLDPRLEVVGISHQPILQPNVSIELIAEKYSETILRSYGSSPVFLAGFSFGGIIAFEVAHQIEKRGGHVEFVGLFDSFLQEDPKPSKSSNLIEFASNLPRWVLNDLQQTQLTDWSLRLKKAFYKIKRRISSKSLSDMHLRQVDEIFDLKHTSSSLKNTLQSHLNAVDQYRPDSIHCKISYFRAKVRPLLHNYRSERAWSHYSSAGLDCYEIPGNHWCILNQDKSLDCLAKSLQTALPLEKYYQS